MVRLSMATPLKLRLGGTCRASATLIFDQPICAVDDSAERRCWTPSTPGRAAWRKASHRVRSRPEDGGIMRNSPKVRHAISVVLALVATLPAQAASTVPAPSTRETATLGAPPAEGRFLPAPQEIALPSEQA